MTAAQHFNVFNFNLFIIVWLCLLFIGFLCIAHALNQSSSIQGIIAWSFFILAFPGIGVPLYLLFGRKRFSEYAKSRYKSNQALAPYRNKIIESDRSDCSNNQLKSYLRKIYCQFPDKNFTSSENISLLINAETAYKEMLKGIRKAKQYILLQSYIIRDDKIGNVFKDELVSKNKLNVYVLYDDIGCNSLSQSFISSLKRSGVNVLSFSARHSFLAKRHQINFRNHRKILVIDGEIAFMGGLNIGDEYICQQNKVKSIRDTHLKIEGCSVNYLQYAFVEDWFWASKEIINLNWVQKNEKNIKNLETFILTHGPDDFYHMGTLTLSKFIYTAKKRIWISSPYFVPNEVIIDGLILAALSGIDVRIMLPKKADHLMVHWCSFSYYPIMEKSGIKIYRYEKGFLHQKVWLMDNSVAAIGTTNLDNRSLELNFEVMLINFEKYFIEEVENMLKEDFENSKLENLHTFHSKPLYFRTLCNLARLFSPLL